jgi:hypothetical protein
LKKRIIAWAVLLSVCAAALGLWCSAATGKAARTLPCEEEGLILSITTFDGKSESKPFLKCFGHTWIGLDNRTGHTVYLKDRAIPDGGQKLQLLVDPSVERGGGRGCCVEDPGFCLHARKN